MGVNAEITLPGPSFAKSLLLKLILKTAIELCFRPTE